MEKIARNVRVTGRVQGVGYRAWTRDRAEVLGLTGWVRNEPDGAVRAHLVGTGAAVSRMLAEMERGPTFARVADVVASDVVAEASDGFEVRR